MKILGLKWLNKTSYEPKETLIFDSFKYNSFHKFTLKNFVKAAKGVSPTLAICKTVDDVIFGAYTDIPWDDNDKLVTHKNNSFVFTLKDNKI